MMVIQYSYLSVIGDEKWITHRLRKSALTRRANVRRPPMMSIAAHIAGTRLVAPRQIVAAVIQTASDFGQMIFVRIEGRAEFTKKEAEICLER